MEVWKDIKGWEGFYQISNLGRVKSLARSIARRGGGIYPVSEKILKPNIVDGYECVRFCINKLEKDFKVHRLVGLHFIFNPDNKPFINHKDSDRRNNIASNLEWCTNQENIKHGFDAGNVLPPSRKGKKVLANKNNDFLTI